MTRRLTIWAAILGTGTMLCPQNGRAAEAIRTYGPDPVLPSPDLSHGSVAFSKVIGWPAEGAPKAPPGFTVTRFADRLDSPRSLTVLPNGDILVAEATTTARAKDAKTAGQVRSGSASDGSPDRILLLRDSNRDGVADERVVLLSDLSQPFGLAFRDDHLYVANTDGVVRFPYKVGGGPIAAKGETILALPAGGYNNHWTRNLLASRDGTKLFVSVGSASNVGEHGMEVEKGRAAIHEVKLDGSDHRIVATGLRNPVGMALEPTTGALWTAVNERDMIGDDLVPDYITSIKDGAFYGWPFSYWGRTPDPRLAGQGADLVATAIAPDYAVGAHTASLGLAFSSNAAFPEAFRTGAFVAQRGSWNRKPFAGYKVIFVPFRDGKPDGEARDFLTGFMKNPETGEAFGRPVGVFQDNDGALLVTDDAGDTIWRVAPTGT